jgi:hypothetical protein|tara:strand:+ start:222 stop:485 length:264 start_codon:yes stop_codon:yes gene_type:complete
LTNIYCYCLFDGRGRFHGVYSSVHAVHRDAVKLCNQGAAKVIMEHNGQPQSPTPTLLRNTLKGAIDVQVIYAAGHHKVRIIKTNLKE